MDIQIVEVNKTDAPFLSELMNSKEILDALKEVPTRPEDWVEAISVWGNDPDEEDYIIFDGDTPIGWLGINGLLDKTAYIKMLAILPQFQNQGVGSHVVNLCVENLKSRKFEKVVLYTDKSNLRAQKCYEKCGFRVTETLTETMSNGEAVPRYKMELRF